MWAPEIASFQGKGSALFFADTQAKDNACEGELLLVLDNLSISHISLFFCKLNWIDVL
jgi:hypothetical protein